LATIELRINQANLHRAAGDAAAEAAAWTSVLDLDHGNAKAHGRLAKILLQQGRTVEAAAHMEIVANQQAGDVEGWKRLARHRFKMGDLAGESAALRRALALQPRDNSALHRMAALAMESGDLEAAAGFLRTLAEASPGGPWHWRALADCLNRLGNTNGEALALDKALSSLGAPHNKVLAFALEAAHRLTGMGHELAPSAWERVLAYAPHSMEARAGLEETRLYGSSTKRDAAPAILQGARQRVLVVGNCQAFGVGRQLRSLCPGAEVRTVSIAEVRKPEDADALAARLAAMDVVITQRLDPSRYGELGSARLKRRTGQLAYYPNILFRGFHPDIARIGADPAYPVPNRGLHSAIVRSAHVLGVPRDQVPDLFNTYIYGVLGYFDEHAKSEAWQIGDAARSGLNLEPLLVEWRAIGVWVHIPNHPVPTVFRSIAKQTAADLGLETADVVVEPIDELKSLGTWPVYPEIAARLGLQGGLTFELGRDAPQMEIDEFIAHSYRIYAGLDPARLLRGVDDVVKTLRAEGV
jgi:tetratricopeptide (TPR) repeat protein